jgi:F-type H+/Na+-transporting ATPase subunit beta
MATGIVNAIRGVVVDVQFPGGDMPEIYEALQIHQNGTELVLEVQQHLSEGLVRAVAMDTTDGLARGVPVHSTGGPIKVPVGPVTLGRIFNIVGEAIDGRPTPDAEHLLPDPSPCAGISGSVGRGQDL